MSLKVKELAQGLQMMMQDGLAEEEVVVVRADGMELPILKVLVDRGVQELEPNTQPVPHAKPKVVVG